MIPDASPFDGGAPDIDSGLGVEAGAADGSALAPDSTLAMAACSYEQGGVVTVANTFVSPDDQIALSVRNDGAALGWIAYEGGKKRLTQLWFSSDGVDMVGVTPSGSTSDQAEPTNAATASGFLTVYSDKATGVYNLQSQAVTALGTAVADPTVLTTDIGVDTTPALAVGKDGNAVVVFQTDAAGVHGRSLLLSADGKPIGTQHEIADWGRAVGHPALAHLGDGYLLAWVDASKRNVHLQRLDAAGSPVGSSTVADAEGSAQGKLELATTATGGALIWDVYVGTNIGGVAGGPDRAEIRFRGFDGTATPTGIESVLTPAPATGLMPTVVPLRGGYALAYRSAVPKNLELRLLLLDRFGALISGTTIAPIKDINLPVAMRVSPDGEDLFLGWVDANDSTAYQLQRTWIHCD